MDFTAQERREIGTIFGTLASCDNRFKQLYAGMEKFVMSQGSDEEVDALESASDHFKSAYNPPNPVPFDAALAFITADEYLMRFMIRAADHNVDLVARVLAGQRITFDQMFFLHKKEMPALTLSYNTILIEQMSQSNFANVGNEVLRKKAKANVDRTVKDNLNLLQADQEAALLASRAKLFPTTQRKLGNG